MKLSKLCRLSFTQGALSGRYELNRRVQDPLFQWNKVTHTLTHAVLAIY